MGVVKANAYGHGSVRTARTLIDQGVTKLSVATVAEAIELRQAGIQSDIVVFAPPLSDRVRLYMDYDLQAVVESENSLALLEAGGGNIMAHVKVDTGMGRLGRLPQESASLIRLTERSKNVKLASVWTHFSRADETDSAFTEIQFNRFMDLVAALGGAPAPLHTAASAAAFSFAPSIDSAHMSMARIGIALYGLLDLPGERPPEGLIPIMEFVSRVSAIKTVPAGSPISYGARWIAPTTRRIATISAGYADGVSRYLTNKGKVRIGSSLFPIVGTVCMDMFMVDLGNPEETDSEVNVGDETILFGMNSPTCFEVADQCSSITYVQVCGISGRVPRKYAP